MGAWEHQLGHKVANLETGLSSSTEMLPALGQRILANNQLLVSLLMGSTGINH